jgi:hypothetical protein
VTFFYRSFICGRSTSGFALYGTETVSFVNRANFSSFRTQRGAKVPVTEHSLHALAGADVGTPLPRQSPRVFWARQSFFCAGLCSAPQGAAQVPTSLRGGSTAGQDGRDDKFRGGSFLGVLFSGVRERHHFSGTRVRGFGAPRTRDILCRPIPCAGLALVRSRGRGALE